MCSREITIQKTAEGLAREQIVQLVRRACAFKSAVLLKTDKFQVNCKSMMGMISLELQPGTPLAVEASGEDEDAALEAVCALLAE